MSGDGTVSEGDLVQALTLLADRQEHAVHNGPDADLIDVVSLSLGYYHEFDTDVHFDSGLQAVLERLAQWGVATVVVGRQRLDRPADVPGGVLAVVGRAGVEGRAGHQCRRDEPEPLGRDVQQRRQMDHVPPSGCGPDELLPGDQRLRAVVLQAVGAGRAAGARPLDPDDFSSGFAIWSGTSFAAPLFAGEVAQYLFENGTDRCRAGQGRHAVLGRGQLLRARAGDSQ